ncbi:hypothetical protein J41TS4_07230 [Paenibacillus apis]|uniref:Uncharacterized protein n=1 Tax=Paenibacillus apis TaxID=1792174 RepID=A0A919Y1Z2_9BACL|nr:hypothetical protein J41TS4_07230 [Paenibacillus apis]
MLNRTKIPDMGATAPILMPNRTKIAGLVSVLRQSAGVHTSMSCSFGCSYALIILQGVAAAQEKGVPEYFGDTLVTFSSFKQSYLQCQPQSMTR